MPASTIRRTLAAVALGLTVATPGLSAETGDFEVTMLGTGTPPPLMFRFGPSTLVQVNGKTFLFDADVPGVLTLPTSSRFHGPCNGGVELM